MAPEGLFSKVLKEESEKTSGAVKDYMHGLGGAVSSVKNMTDLEMWPDVDKIDNLVEVWTVVGYTFGVASVLGATYFTLRITREFGQWRSWLRLRTRKK